MSLVRWEEVQAKGPPPPPVHAAKLSAKLSVDSFPRPGSQAGSQAGAAPRAEPASEGEEEGELLGGEEEMQLDYQVGAAGEQQQQRGAQQPPSGEPAPALYQPSHTSRYRAFFKRDGVEVEAEVTVSSEYPDLVPEWRLLCAWQLQRVAKLGGMRMPQAQLDVPGLANQLRALEQEVNVSVPEHVPEEEREQLLGYQVVALMRGLGACAEGWPDVLPGPLGTAARVRGPDGHAYLGFKACLFNPK